MPTIVFQYLMHSVLEQFESCMELGLTGFGSMQYVDPAGLSVKLLEPHGFGVAKL